MFVFFCPVRFLEMAGRHRALSLTGAGAASASGRLREGRPEIVGVVDRR
jgi:hypothetical protein